MNIISSTNRVHAIRARYFTSNKAIMHHMDCRIYSYNGHGQRGAFCDCGLIHDLYMLEFSLAEVLFENMEKDFYLQDTGKPLPKMTKKRMKMQEECMKLLENVFGPPAKLEMIDIKNEYDDMRKIIKAVFPRKREYPDCYNRLDSWLENKLKENNT